MGRYAEGTSVAVEKSRAELERVLERYGASAFAYGWDQVGARIQFQAHDRFVRFDLPLPSRSDPQFTHHSRGRRSPQAASEAWEQGCRQRWRALVLVVKAKLEAVESGISEFEDEFLAHIVLPDGKTTGEWMRPQIRNAYESGAVPQKLVLSLPVRAGS